MGKRRHRIGCVSKLLAPHLLYDNPSSDWITISCHGPAIFTDLLDPSNGELIVKGKRITGFTTEAESDMGIIEGLRAWNEPLIDEHAKALGAQCMLLDLCTDRIR